MKMQVQPTSNSCLIAATAMLLDVPIAELMKEVGHNGTEKVFKTGKELRRGFHITEINNLFMERGYALVTIEKNPLIWNIKQEIYALPKQRDLIPFIKEDQKTGILYLLSNIGGHAVAVDKGEMVFDPKGLTYPIDMLHEDDLMEFYWKIKIKSE